MADKLMEFIWKDEINMVFRVPKSEYYISSESQSDT